MIQFNFQNNKTLELTPAECWELVDKTRNYLIDQYKNFDPIPFKTIKKNKKCFNVSITGNINFWNRLEEGRWEPKTFEIFDNFLSHDYVYFDIGSWIGPTVLYASQLVKQTYSFEPDPIAYEELKSNLSLNKNSEWESRLTIYNKAIASNVGLMKLGSRNKGGDSMSSSLFSHELTNWNVETTTLNKIIENENLSNEKIFIKMDIEGGEYELIPNLKPLFQKFNITLFISLHPNFLMHSLNHEKNNNTQIKIYNRLLFVWHHIKLLQALKFKYLYHSNKKPFYFILEIFKSLLNGKFATEIIATNKKMEHNIKNP